MSDAQRALVDYLAARGWKQRGQGPAGELWGQGHALTAVPNDLEAGSAAWRHILYALAPVERQSFSALESWLMHTLEQGRQRPQLRRRTDGDERVELDVHLDGPTVHNHETRAYDFGRFVMRSAETVKEFVKSARGVRHQSRSLLVAGGPIEGSVRVILREPDKSDADSLLPGAPETVEGQALVLMSAIFGAAEESRNDLHATVLRSHLTPLNIRARHDLARLAQVQIDAGWLMHGVIRRGSEESDFSMGLGAAHTIRDVAREALEQERTETVRGTLDGWVWSTSQLSLIAEDRRPIRVSVPMPLQNLVAELNAERGTRVVTRLNVYSRVASGTGDSVRTEYSLASITRDESLPTLD